MEHLKILKKGLLIILKVILQIALYGYLIIGPVMMLKYNNYWLLLYIPHVITFIYIIGLDSKDIGIKK